MEIDRSPYTVNKDVTWIVRTPCQLRRNWNTTGVSCSH